MKTNAIIKTMVVIIIAALMSVGNMFGQTATSTTQTVVQKPASEVLSDILKSTSPDILKTIYPPGFLDNLQAMGDSLYPPTPPVVKKSLAKASPMGGGGMSPMDNQQSSPPTYAVIDLGTLGGDVSLAYGINNNGQVAGYASTSNNLASHAFLYSGGVMQDLGTLGDNDSYAYGINNSGEVVGQAPTTYDVVGDAFLYSGGVMQDLGTLGGTISAAKGINSSGQVAGYSYFYYFRENAFAHAFLYSGGMQDLGTLASQFYFYSFGYGINDGGQVVGSTQIPNLSTHAFLYSGGVMQDLGTLGGVNSQANGINNSSQIVGNSYTSNGLNHAFLYSNGSMQDLGTLQGNSDALAINAGGQIVGYSYIDNNNNTQHAFLYMNGSIQDLNSLITINHGWTLQSATAINDSGQIVGYGINPSGQTHAFLLNPLPSGALLACTNSQTNLPPYGDLPVKGQYKDGLVVVTHGWTPKWVVDPVMSTAWVDNFSNVLSQRLSADGRSDWQTFGFKWITNSWVLNPGNALSAANAEGKRLGDRIAEQGWTKVHFISHSAGGELIETATEEIRAKATNEVTIQCTFLDPYIGSVYEEQYIYGAAANWSDCYVSDDITGGWTAQPLRFAYNAKVSALDQTTVDQIPSYVSLSDPSSPCYQEGLSTHYWPVIFYTNTVANNSSAFEWGLYDGFGYDLSQEGGNWDYATSQYVLGNGVSYGSVTNLGPEYPSCVAVEGGNTQSFESEVNFPLLSKLASTTGSFQIGPGILSLTNGSPVWIATVITATNALNKISFDAEFTSAGGAHGLLSVYWDTNMIGLLDEAEVQPGLQHYTMPFPLAAAETSHVLGFHLDPFTSVHSSITLTNVVIGWAGVTQQPILSVTTNRVNSLLVFQLSGQPDNYIIQATTDLASTNWMNVAILGNTSGSVEFTDTSSTNYPCRFYRALAQ